jgi:hypothetical protein
MLFSDSERKELASFFSKRFSDPTIRAMLAKRAGVKTTPAEETSPESWDSLILLAQRRRKLAKLAQVAAKMDLGDQNLQAVCNLLGARARTVRNRAIGAGMAAAVALGFGFGGWMIGTDTAPEVASVTPEIETAFATAVIPVPTPIEETPAVAEVKPTKELSPREIRRLAREEARRNRPPTGPAWRNGRCTYDKPGQFIGYWYAGKKIPGQVEELIDIAISVNVRQDYPSGKNGFNTKAPVRCILRRGDKVKLTAAAIEVGRGHYWVPLYHGDLVAEAPQEIAAL